MVRQAQLILLLFYYRLHVSTYIQVIFRPFERRVRKCYACWDPIMFIGITHKVSGTSTALRNIYYSDQHKHFMCLRILSLWTYWDPNMHSIYGLSCQKAWRWSVCRSKHVACNKTTIKSVVPDVPLFYFIRRKFLIYCPWRLASIPFMHRHIIIRLGIVAVCIPPLSTCPNFQFIYLFIFKVYI